ncbi:hypothetical protein AF331_19865 [Rossellomorea marisflavi]|uniref:Uncharacterized protein n=1 Tax=Rossellomorea marisflavi TaxID=189381 RepID=A0A0M0G0H0_9BACI|nr:hypothetical protein AF331_19865 [Rossellomorea marisflavi]
MKDANCSFPLQGLAFRGEAVEPPQLRFRGLELPSIPAGVKSLPLQFTPYYWSLISLERTRFFIKFVWNNKPISFLYKRCRKEDDRSFPLQGFAFRGEAVEPPQLRFRGLELPSIPAGVKSLPLQSALRF